MDPERIRTWRPTRFAEVIGAKNRPVVTRTQRALTRGRMYSKALFVAPFGCGKTSFIELILKSINCKHQDSSTGDPCHNCTSCEMFHPRNNGYGDPYRRFVKDCTKMNRAEVVEFVADHYYYEDMVVFFDELHVGLNPREFFPCFLRILVRFCVIKAQLVQPSEVIAFSNFALDLVLAVPPHEGLIDLLKVRMSRHLKSFPSTR